VQVVDGRIRRDALKVRVLRMGQVQWEGKVRQLKQVKNTVEQVGAGAECGVMLDGWEGFEVGDKIEVVEMVARKPKVRGTETGAVKIDE
jgi:translation initiation factor IF-2